MSFCDIKREKHLLNTLYPSKLWRESCNLIVILPWSGLSSHCPRYKLWHFPLFFLSKVYLFEMWPGIFRTGHNTPVSEVDREGGLTSEWRVLAPRQTNMKKRELGFLNAKLSSCSAGIWIIELRCVEVQVRLTDCNAGCDQRKIGIMIKNIRCS